jgi:hypothetical protein
MLSRLPTWLKWLLLIIGLLFLLLVLVTLLAGGLPDTPQAGLILMGQILVAAVSILAGIGEFATWIRSLLQEKPAPDHVPLPRLPSRPLPEPALPPSLLHFTDRQDEIAAFRAWLDDPAPARWVWTVHGLSGLGKSTLADWLRHRECTPRHIPTARLDFARDLLRSDRRLVLDTLEAHLRPAAPADAWTAYHTRRDQLERQLAALRPSTVHYHVDQTMTAAVGGIIRDTSQRMGGDGREYAEAQKHILAQMALAFARALAAGQGPLVVFCDTWEALQATGADLRAWLADALFAPLHDLRPAARLVIAGRQQLAYPPLQAAAAPNDLHPFTRPDSDAYLDERGLHDPTWRAAIYDQAQGNPLLTALWADLWAEGGGLDAADLSHISGEWTARAATEWVIGRMVTRLEQTDPRTAHALRYGVILRPVRRQVSTA